MKRWVSRSGLGRASTRSRLPLSAEAALPAGCKASALTPLTSATYSMAQKRQEWAARGHGSYQEVEEKEFFKASQPADKGRAALRCCTRRHCPCCIATPMATRGTLLNIAAALGRRPLCLPDRSGDQGRGARRVPLLPQLAALPGARCEPDRNRPRVAALAPDGAPQDSVNAQPPPAICVAVDGWMVHHLTSPPAHD